MKNFIFSMSLFLLGLAPVKHPVHYGKISGIVADKSTKEPLIGAQVAIYQNQVKKGLGNTDIDGKFSFSSLLPGVYTLKIRYIGFDTLSKTGIHVRSGKTTWPDTIFLSQDTTTLKEVVIMGRESIQYESKSVEMRVETMSGVVSNYNRAPVNNRSYTLNADQTTKGDVYKLDGIRYNSSPGPDKISNKVKGTQDSINDAEDAEDFDEDEIQNKIVENTWQQPEAEPMSTFSIDVDAAAYSNIRHYINEGELPPKSAVRLEEMINYFTYEYPQPKHNEPFTVISSVASCPWNPAHKLVQLGLQGRSISEKNLPPSNLVFLIDVSGSMDEPERLPLVKMALNMLVKKLRKEDMISIVVYAGNAGLVLPPTSGDQKDKIMNAINNLEAGGSTAGGAGIELAYKIAEENFMAKGNNRVILSTDGDFNVGISDDASLVKMIEEKRKNGVFLSVLGVGEGNFKDQKMEQLADKGNGNYNYIDNIDEANKVLVKQFAGTIFTIAKDVKIQVEWNPLKVKEYRLIGYENRMLNKEDFANDTVDAGELGSGHTVTALYEIIPANAPEMVPGQKELSQKTAQNSFSQNKNDLMIINLRFKRPGKNKSELRALPLADKNTDFENAENNLKWAASVAGFGMLIRSSAYKGDISFDKIISWANSSKGKDAEGYRSEFINLVKAAAVLQQEAKMK